MSFTNLLFLFAFLPSTWLLWLLMKRTPLANAYLVLVSFLFYSFGSLRSLAILVGTLVFNFFIQLAIGKVSLKTKSKEKLPPLPEEKKALPSLAFLPTSLVSWNGAKLLLAIGILVNLALLFVFKYWVIWWPSSLSQELSSFMPVGISFYTLSILSCLIDVYFQKRSYEPSLINFALLISFFGWINMGPIISYAQVQPQLRHHVTNRKKNAQGMGLFLQGLFHKVVLADNLALVVVSLADNLTWIGQIGYGIAYFLQLYFDFSGYSRMARGCASLFGFTIPKNFDLPLTALSIQEFWRRWHISLTTWFKQYVYFPLGGSRVKSMIWIRNVLCVWILTGFWHGPFSSYFAWGLYQAILLILEKKVWGKHLRKLAKWIRHLYVLVLELFGMAFFASENISQAFIRIGHYLGFGLQGFLNQGSLFWLYSMGAYFIMGAWIAGGFSLRFSQAFLSQVPKSWMIWQVLGYLVMLVVCVIFLLSATSKNFLYAQF